MVAGMVTVSELMKDWPIPSPVKHGAIIVEREDGRRRDRQIDAPPAYHRRKRQGLFRDRCRLH